MAALFAATYPERTRALALFNPVALSDPTAYGPPLSAIREEWGTREFSDRLLSLGAPALVEDRGAPAESEPLERPFDGVGGIRRTHPLVELRAGRSRMRKPGRRSRARARGRCSGPAAPYGRLSRGSQSFVSAVSS
jgi:pimeloyl-ACP methyl ester carboxylesterase